MARAELTRAVDAIMAQLSARPNLPFSELVDSVQREANTDEATAKAAVLRLSSEGTIEVTSDWIVRPVKHPAEAA